MVLVFQRTLRLRGVKPVRKAPGGVVVWIPRQVDRRADAAESDRGIAVFLYCGVRQDVRLIATDFAGRVKLVKVNVDEAPELSRRFEVQGIPTLLVTRDGKVIARQTGAAGEPALRTWLERALDIAAAVPNA